MGILYVCVRNVAMSCSNDLTGNPDFTRMAPYRLVDAPKLGVPEDEYRLSMLCRLAGQRGLPLPDDITPSRVMRYHGVAFAWMLAVRELLERKMNDG